jgi:hypothetical protein
MHASKADLEPMVIGEYSDGGEDEVVRAGEAYHLRPGHFVQTLEPGRLVELSPVEEHDRTMATVARNLGVVAG